MPFNGSGTFTRVMDWTNDRDAAIKIRADRHDQNDDDIANGLSNVICRDGQSQITANIPFNGKRITGLANPVDPQDGATKNYADAIRSFPTPIVIAGNDANGRLRFTGAQTDATNASANPLGIEFFNSDLFFGVRRYTSVSAPNRFVWNASASPDTTDLMTLWENGPLTLGGGTYLSSIIQTPQPGTVFFRKRNTPAPGRWYWNITDTGLVGGANDVSIASLDDTGRFTTIGIIVSGTELQSGNGIFKGVGQVVIGPSAASNIWLRPQGPTNSLNESIFHSNGQVSLAGPVYVDGVAVALISPGTANTTTVFPVGTELLCGSNIPLVRQTVYGVYLEGSGGGWGYICHTAPTGWTVGSILSGTWVVRGTLPCRNSADTGTIYAVQAQRVA